MLQIKHLSKIYKSKNVEVHALNDINLEIQDKGMVFILIDKEFLTKKGWISSETPPSFLITYYRENN